MANKKPNTISGGNQDTGNESCLAAINKASKGNTDNINAQTQKRLDEDLNIIPYERRNRL